MTPLVDRTFVKSGAAPTCPPGRLSEMTAMLDEGPRPAARFRSPGDSVLAPPSGRQLRDVDVTLSTLTKNLTRGWRSSDVAEPAFDERARARQCLTADHAQGQPAFVWRVRGWRALLWLAT
jgi:hypothetical protein